MAFEIFFQKFVAGAPACFPLALIEARFAPFARIREPRR